MVDARFHAVGAGMTLADIAALLGAEIVPGGAADWRITGVAPLSVAGASDISFLDAKRHLPAFEASSAGACLTTADLSKGLDPARNLLLVTHPKAAHARLGWRLHPEPAVREGIHPAAQVDPEALVAGGVSIGAGAVVEAGAQIGEGAEIGAATLIGKGVAIGPGCRIASHVTITHALIGARVRIAPGARIGQAGFGFVPGPRGLEPIPQLGRVRIGDDVDIGANVCIDRGAGDDTVIGPGTKIDNLVQIGHNCRIGAHCVIVGQAGLAGSVTIGDGAMLGARAGVADHVTVGAGARLAAMAGVMRDVPPGATHGGIPAQDIRDWHKETAFVRRMKGRKDRPKDQDG